MHQGSARAIRLWELDKELNKEESAFLKEKVPIKELRELALISGVAKYVSRQGDQPISKHTTLKIMDWLESEEFLLLLVSFKFGTALEKG